MAMDGNGHALVAWHGYNGTAHNRIMGRRFNMSFPPSNLAPTDISLSASSVPENSTAGTVVGNLSASDPDPGDTHIFTLQNNAGGRFAVSGNQLVVAVGAVLNFETGTSHSITVRATDAHGLFFDESLTITVTNVNEQPTNLSLSGATVPEQRYFEQLELKRTTPPPGSVEPISPVDAVMTAWWE